MKNEYYQIISFFLKLREHDQANRPVPAFDELVGPGGRTKRMRFGFIPIGIAAGISMIILFYALLNTSGDTTNAIQQTTVLMGEKEENTQMIINDSQEISLSTWESPTSTLINDF